MANMDPSPRPRKEDLEPGEILERIPPSLYTLMFGMMALGISGLAWMDSFSLVATFDLPVVFLLTVANGLICMGAGSDRTRSLTGLVFAAVALVLSCVHLLTARDHPWLA